MVIGIIGRKIVWCGILAVSFLAGTAGLAEEGDDAGMEAPAPSAASGAKEEARPAAPEFTDFAQEMAAALTERKPALVDDALDFAAFFRIAIGGFSLPDQFATGLRHSIQDKLKFGSQLLQAFPVESRVEAVLTRCVADKVGVKAVIRLSGESGANWLEFHLIKNADGAVRYEDAYQATSGCLISERIRQMLMPALLHESSGALTKLFADQTKLNDCKSALTIIGRAMQEFRAGNAAKALQLYYTMPESQRWDFQYQVIAAQFSTQADESGEAYNKVLQEIFTHNGNNPGAQLMLVDYYFTQKEYEKARSCIAKIGERFGMDGYVALLMGNCYLLEEKYPEAAEWYRKGRLQEPRLADLYDAEAVCYNKRNEYAAMRRLWVDFQKAFPAVDVEGIFAPEHGETYHNFKQSSDYKVMLDQLAELKEQFAKNQKEAETQETAPAK